MADARALPAPPRARRRNRHPRAIANPPFPPGIHRAAVSPAAGSPAPSRSRSPSCRARRAGRAGRSCAASASWRQGSAVAPSRGPGVSGARAVRVGGHGVDDRRRRPRTLLRCSRHRGRRASSFSPAGEGPPACCLGSWAGLFPVRSRQRGLAAPAEPASVLPACVDGTAATNDRPSKAAEGQGQGQGRLTCTSTAAFDDQHTVTVPPANLTTSPPCVSTTSMRFPGRAGRVDGNQRSARSRGSAADPGAAPWGHRRQGLPRARRRVHGSTSASGVRGTDEDSALEITWVDDFSSARGSKPRLGLPMRLETSPPSPIGRASTRASLGGKPVVGSRGSTELPATGGDTGSAGVDGDPRRTVCPRGGRKRVGQRQRGREITMGRPVDHFRRNCPMTATLTASPRHGPLERADFGAGTAYR